MMKKEKISKTKSPDTSKKRKMAKDELHESEELDCTPEVGQNMLE